jgi:Questin oxidase-like
MGNYIDTVTDALERLDDLGYERGGNDFANHGPMAAEALAVLGFGAEVPGWVNRYRSGMKHHDPPSPRWALDPRDESSWRPAMGAFDRVGDWEQLFRGLLREQPWNEVVVEWWPRLLPGLFARLTHGLIRTAHAVRNVAAAAEPNEIQLRELARGLAYWAARHQPLPGSAHLTGSRTVADAVAGLARRPAEAAERNPGERLRTLGTQDAYRVALDDLAVGEPDWLLSEMTTTFAGVYLAHPEIAPVPLVHGVTAPAAIRLVLPFLPEQLRLASVAAMWQGHLAMLLAFTTSTTDEQQVSDKAAGIDVPAAPELMARALANGDEHVIKLTEAALREHALRPDPRFPAAILAVQERIQRRA